MDAKYLSSLRRLRVAVPLRRPSRLFLASSETRRSRSSFSAIGTANGSFSCGVSQRSRYALTGASCTGLGWMVALALAMIDGFAGDARDLFRRDERRRREAPRAVDDHAHAEAEARILRDIRDGQGLAGAALGREAQADALIADAHDADIGVGGLEFLGFRAAPRRRAFPVRRWAFWSPWARRTVWWPVRRKRP